MAKLTRAEFERRYWGAEVDSVPASTRREFYSDYRESGLSFAAYQKSTTAPAEIPMRRRNPAGIALRLPPRKDLVALGLTDWKIQTLKMYAKYGQVRKVREFWKKFVPVGPDLILEKRTFKLSAHEGPVRIAFNPRKNGTTWYVYSLNFDKLTPVKRCASLAEAKRFARDRGETKFTPEFGSWPSGPFRAYIGEDIWIVDNPPANYKRNPGKVRAFAKKSFGRAAAISERTSAVKRMVAARYGLPPELASLEATALRAVERRLNPRTRRNGVWADLKALFFPPPLPPLSFLPGDSVRYVHGETLGRVDKVDLNARYAGGLGNRVHVVWPGSYSPPRWEYEGGLVKVAKKARRR